MRDFRHGRRRTIVSGIAALILAVAGLSGGLPGTAHAESANIRSSNIWDGLKTDVFGDKAIQTDTGIVRLDAPKRAQDAALVPVDIFVDPKKAPEGLKALTLIVDVNPSPVAATFKFGNDAGVTHLATRLRVDDYSFIRVIAETPDGKLHMAETFVKASGGCSAPAVKNAAEARKTMGQMKLRQFSQAESADGASQELQVMIRHPNNSGLQKDPLTHYFIPPHFIHQLTVSQGDRPIFSMEGGISISEDPNFRFDYKSDGKGEIRVEATDTKGQVFGDKWPLEAAGL
ncbi:quinoprotein dehydrogenase-associated SoxYZ-like carrier [Pseudaminobacter sp. NGMCC 1.201702]|uniref:quinoprotein dehydrogenase-associated SoxYZ-like carrier n=1 Tax=Pseudaminobacter sp. NGMCC 1.201702 TaxID=3391825 RepID=UPI0039EE5A71